jgi:hypothetical protein
MTQVTSGPLNSPYRQAFLRLPSSIQSALWDFGYSRTQPDGELLKESLEIEQSEQQCNTLWETTLGASILDKCMEYNDLIHEISETKHLIPGHRPEGMITDLLDQLVGLVSCGKQADSYNTFEMEWALGDRQHCAQQFAPLSELAQITKRWRRWKPRSGNHTPATTQRIMELTLRERWLERALAPLF